MNNSTLGKILGSLIKISDKNRESIAFPKLPDDYIIDNLIQEITNEFSITTVINSHDMNSVMEIGV